MTNRCLTALDIFRTAALVDEIEALAAKSPEALATQFDIMAGVLDDMHNAFASGVNQTIETGDFRDATISVVTQCGDAMS